MPRRLWLLVLALLSATACGTSTQPQGCDICVTGAVVYGRLTNSAGAPVGGARVAVDLHTSSCSLSNGGWDGGATLSDAQGSYRLLAISPAAPAAACVIVTVTPPDSVRASVTADSGRIVQLRDTYPGTVPLDSIRVDIVVRPRP